MKDIINNLKKCDTWKIHSIVVVNFVSPKETNEECEMHSKSDDIEFTNYDEVIKELLNHFLIDILLVWKHH